MILSPEPNCGEKLSCVARSGKWKGLKICVEEEFICDNTLQCLGGEDEVDCEESVYIEKKIFKPSELFVCRRTFKYLSDAAAKDISQIPNSTMSPGIPSTTSSTLAPTTLSLDEVLFGDGEDYEDYDDDIFGRRRRKRDATWEEGWEIKKRLRKFFPLRAVECDGVKQCPHGEDEEVRTISLLQLVVKLNHSTLVSDFWFPQKWTPHSPGL